MRMTSTNAVGLTLEWKSPFGMQGFVMFEWLLRKVRFQSLDGRNRKHHFLSYWCFAETHLNFFCNDISRTKLLDVQMNCLGLKKFILNRKREIWQHNKKSSNGFLVHWVVCLNWSYRFKRQIIEKRHKQNNGAETNECSLSILGKVSFWVTNIKNKRVRGFIQSGQRVGLKNWSG